MKDNKLIIQINKSVSEVFEFTTNPRNTHLWIDSIVAEKTNEWPVKVGSKYRNQNQKGEWSEYVVTQYQPNKIFELKSDDGNYHVSYSYKDLGNESELEYYEWVDSGELDDPFNQKTLQNLNTILEQ